LRRIKPVTSKEPECLQKDRLARGRLLERIDPEIKVFDGLDEEFYSNPDEWEGLLENVRRLGLTMIAHWHVDLHHI
jgi:hypothetical protein